MNKTIVCDTSCLIALEHLELLDILKSVYGTIIITREVKEEYGIICFSNESHFMPIYRLISFSLLRASTGVRLLMSMFLISSRICLSTGSSN